MGAGGQPTKYNKDIAEMICDLIKMGKTIDEICSLKSMPCPATYYNWRNEYPEFLEKCNVAEKDSADALMLRGIREVYELPRVKAWQDQDGTLYSDDQVKELTGMEKSAMGLEKVGLSSELVARAKLINDASRQLAAIRHPEKYSEKRQIKMEVTASTKAFLDGLDDD